MEREERLDPHIDPSASSDSSDTILFSLLNAGKPWFSESEIQFEDSASNIYRDKNSHNMMRKESRHASNPN
jgi:hypothetical protein